MQIVIPIKQVPETGNVKMDEKTGTMIREGVESIINPLDLYAVETGIELKEKYGGEITVITMGPPSAEKALREAAAMGCDRAVLLSGKEFAGSDTWATSYALSRAVEHESVSGGLKGFDLILTGERATDGDTGQVGPGLASFLNLPLATYVSRIVKLNPSPGPVERENRNSSSGAGGRQYNGTGYLLVERLIEEGYEELKLPLPALLTVVKEISYPRLPTLRGKQRARKMEIIRLNADSLGIDRNDLGLKGSPTRVVKIDRPRVVREGQLLKVTDGESLGQAVGQLSALLQKEGLFEGVSP